MAIQVIPRARSHAETAGDLLGESIGTYMAYKLKQGKERKIEEAQKEERKDLSAALQAQGYDKKTADTYSKLDKNTLGSLLDMDFKKKLFEQKTGTMNQQLQAQQQEPRIPQEEPFGQLYPQPEMTPQEQQQLQEQKALQAVSLQGTSPKDTMQPLNLGLGTTFSPNQVKELKDMVSDSLKKKEVSAKEASKFLDTLGIDKMSKKIIFGNKLDKTLIKYFLDLSDNDPEKAMELAKSFGYKV